LAIIIWPVEETGRNSVTPSTTPRITASNHRSSAAGEAEDCPGGDGAADAGTGSAAKLATSRRGSSTTKNRTMSWFHFERFGATVFRSSLPLRSAGGGRWAAEKSTCHRLDGPFGGEVRPRGHRDAQTKPLLTVDVTRESPPDSQKQSSRRGLPGARP
jgi:hypothetical protein